MRIAMALFALVCVPVAASAQDELVIASVRVFTGQTLMERASIVVNGGRVTRIVPTPPAGARVVIDGQGKTALPGLIDSHAHIFAATAGVTEAETRAFVKTQLQERLLAMLRHGITTVKSLGDPKHGPSQPLASSALLDALKNPVRSYVPTLYGAIANPALLEGRSRTVAAARKAGVRIVAVSDVSGPKPPGTSLLEEMQLLVKAGLSPEEAIESATSVAAVHVGREKEIGTLAPGMAADILIVRGNPLTDIAAISQTDRVIQAGRVVHAATPATR